MIPHRRNNCRGMSLVEVLVYTAISAVVLNLCAVTFINTTRIASFSTERVLRQQALARFSRDFVRTVHGASRVLPNAGSAVTGEDQVVLDTPDGPVVVGVAGKVLAIWRLESENNTWSIGRITTYPVAFTGIRFDLDTANIAEARRITAHIAGPARKDPEDKANDRDIVAGLRVNGAAP